MKNTDHLKFKSWKNKNTTCVVDNCAKPAVALRMCSTHYHRVWENGTVLKKPMKYGSEHHSWRGGLADYPNHALFKKMRLIKLGQTDKKCERCGKRARIVHHKDRNKSNHAIENLECLCKKCHFTEHSKFKNGKSKYKCCYHYTQSQIAKLLKKSVSWVQFYHSKKRRRLALKKHLDLLKVSN